MCLYQRMFGTYREPDRTPRQVGPKCDYLLSGAGTVFQGGGCP